MNFDTDWDIEKYRSPFECDEHWQLRKDFLLAHKNKYPEDRLISLAQVFFNIELLGCKYPKETTDLILELSEGIADSFREKRKQKLQRTFVEASDAAGSRLKGISPTKISIASDSNENTNITEQNTNQLNSSGEGADIISVSVMHFKNIFAQQNLFENLILLKTVDENFLKHGSAILHRSLSKIRISPQFSYERCQIENNPIWKCSIMIHNKVVSDSTATTKQSAKKAAIEVLLNELRRTCFTLEQKVKILSDGCTIDRTINENINETPISENNIGCKIMKLMGWKGGGLGKTEQGSCNPIVIHDHVHKSGFGANLAQFELMEKLKLKLQKYAEMDTNYDLVFSNDFSKNERAKLHVIARKLSLNTRSYGLSKDRYLVVSKRIANHQSILETLINCDGENEQYRLIPPLKLEVDSTDTNSIVI